jgi:hypothetical protein
MMGGNSVAPIHTSDYYIRMDKTKGFLLDSW